MLHRAWIMVGNLVRRGPAGRGEADLLEQLADIARERGDPTCRPGRIRVAGQHMAVILDRGTATRSIDYDRIETARGELARPGCNVGAGRTVCIGLASHVQGERAAAASAPGDQDLAAVPGEQADGRRVDRTIERLLRAAREQRHPFAARTLRRKRARRQQLGLQCFRRDHLDQRPQFSRQQADK
jgi:hypothetical protein